VIYLLESTLLLTQSHDVVTTSHMEYLRLFERGYSLAERNKLKLIE